MKLLLVRSKINSLSVNDVLHTLLLSAIKNSQMGSIVDMTAVCVCLLLCVCVCVFITVCVCLLAYSFLMNSILGKWYKRWISSLRSPLHFPFSSFLDPGFLHGILLSNSISLRSSVNVTNREQCNNYLTPCRPQWSRGNVLASRSKVRELKSGWGRWIFFGT